MAGGVAARMQRVVPMPETRLLERPPDDLDCHRNYCGRKCECCAKTCNLHAALTRAAPVVSHRYTF